MSNNPNIHGKAFKEQAPDIFEGMEGEVPNKKDAEKPPEDASHEDVKDGNPKDSDEERRERHEAMLERMRNMHAAKKKKKEAGRQRSLANLRRGSAAAPKKTADATAERKDEDEGNAGEERADVSLVAAEEQAGKKKDF